MIKRAGKLHQPQEARWVAHTEENERQARRVAGGRMRFAKALDAGPRTKHVDHDLITLSIRLQHGRRHRNAFASHVREGVPRHHRVEQSQYMEKQALNSV